MTTPTPPPPTPPPTTKLAVQDPQALLARAIEVGAGIETIERLVSLAKEVRAFQAREAWYTAMAAFQANLPEIKKTLTARIQGRAQFSYTYAPLDEMLAAVRPVLGAHGLSVSWRTPAPQPDRVSVACRVAHELGHVEDSGEVSTPIDNTSSATPPQRVGSAMTYCRRYSMMNILGIAPEADDDANGAPEEPEKRSASAPRTAPLDEWIQAIEETQSPTALQGVWKVMNESAVFRTLSPDQMARVIAARDNAKRRLGID